MDRTSSGRGQRRGRSGGARGRGANNQQRGASQGRRSGYGDEKGACPPLSEPNISKELSKIQISSPQTGACASIPAPNDIPPNRPCHGTIGSDVRVLVNFLKIEIPDIKIHQYDVKIYDLLPGGEAGDRNITEKYVCKMVMRSLSQVQLEHQYPAYNGRSILYCRCKVEGRYEVAWVDSDDGNRERKHLVVLKYATPVDLSLINELTHREGQFSSKDERVNFLNPHQAATNAVDAIFRQFAASIFTLVGRAFYSCKRPFNLGGGLELWEGFSQSLRPGQKQAFLNIDLSYRPFIRPIKVLDFLCDALKRSYYIELKDPNIRQDAANHLSMLEVYPDHLKYKRKFKIKESRNVFLAPADVESFLFKGKKVTVEEYFKNEYHKALKFPDLPCLNVGRGDRVVALPMEVCWIKEGQTTKQELDIKQKREMIEATSTLPHQRYSDVIYFAKQAQSENHERDHYGIKTDLNMVEATAKVLPSPVVIYAGSDKLKNAMGKWQIGGKHFVQSTDIETWAVVHFSERADKFNYNPLIKEIQKQGRDKGLLIERPINESDINYFSSNLSEGLDEIDKLLNYTVKRFGKDLQMILCIIDRNIRGVFRGDKWNSDIVYNRIKLVGDTKLSIITQCIDEKNARDPKPCTIGGLCLKINAKQGGINHFAEFEKTKSLLSDTIVIGADVNHPKPGIQDFPSIAAACVALDPTFSRYASTCRFQKNPVDPRQRQEVILEFEDMCLELLRKLKPESGNRRQKILCFRDGVSEGQFQAVIDLELRALKRACHRIALDYNPLITLVCVQKRHHMKMFVNGKERIENVNPGTYLDNTITHPFEYDFYLCSHVALKGTAKAAHYHVLHDENRFPPDILYMLTYQLCYCYARCTKSVSIPPPVYHADLIAYRYSKYFDPRVVRGEDPAMIDWDRLRREVQACIEPGKMFWA